MTILHNHNEGKDLGLDGNDTATVSKTFEIDNINAGTLFVSEASGDIAGMVIGIELSPDGTTWFDTVWGPAGNFTWLVGPFVKGENLMVQGEAFSVDYMRVKVATASTIASTFDLVLVGK